MEHQIEAGMTRITAKGMAIAAGINPEAFGRALRAKRFPWHEHNRRWNAECGSQEHHDMATVIRIMSRPYF